MSKAHRNREYWFARLACLALVTLALLQPLTAVAGIVTWGAAIALASIAGSQRILGRLG